MKPSHLHLLPFLLLLLLLVTAGLAGYWEVVRNSELQAQEATGDILHQIRQRDTALDKDVLHITSFQLNHYDTLVEAVHGLRALQSQLQSLAANHYPGAAADLARYVSLSEEKIRQLEQLKSTSASLNNTLQYLPTVVSELMAKGNGKNRERVSELFAALLVYNLLPTETERTRLAAEIAALHRTRATDDLLHNMLFHAAANLRFRDGVDQLLQGYGAVATAEAIAELQDSHTRFFEQRAKRSDNLSLAMFVVTGLLLGLLAYTIRILIQARANAEAAWRQLNDAVESISEGFALFDADRKLVLWNKCYQSFYPYLTGLLAPGVPLETINQAGIDSGLVRSQHSVNCVRSGARHSAIDDDRVEHLAAGRCYLVSESTTSNGGVASVHVDITERRQMEEKLQEMFQAVEQSPSSVIIAGLDGTIEYTNPKFEEISGYSFAEVVGKNPRLLKSGETTPEEYRELWATITAGQEWHGEFHNRRKNGDLYWEAATISGIRGADGAIVRYLAVKEDISERKRSEEQLRLAAKVFEKTTEAVIVTDASNTIKAVNPGFSQITGYSPAEVIGQKPDILASGRHDATFYRVMWQTLSETDCWEGEIWNRRKNGEIYPEWLSLATIRDDNSQVVEYIGVFSDITRRKEAERKIRWQANYDSLTELPNRSLFFDRLSSALITARREQWLSALMFVDLDRFKVVNDTLGHTTGDLLLQQVAQRLVGCVRANDTVARLGGDEFTVILQNIAREESAAEVAGKVIERMAEVFMIGDQEVFIGASIGITLYPRDGEDAATLIGNADLSMYQAKEAGRNGYRFFTREMNERLRGRMDLERDLRHALAHDEFFLEYQPIVSRGSGRVVSAEALVRWNHPRLGRLEPGRFIVIAEEIGLIAPLGEWVLRTACKQAAEWTDSRQPAIGVSVNVSTQQLKLGLTPETVDAIVTESGLPPHLLTLEITESLMIEDAEGALRWLGAIKKLGIRLSIDDFGTGYSSLSYLKRFPVDMLKIDKSFIGDANVDADDASLIEAIVTLARNFNIKAIAEGVETEDQLTFLADHQCDLIQGFYFSRPLSAAGFREFVAAGIPGGIGAANHPADTAPQAR